MCIACNSRAQVAGNENSVQPMFAAIGKRPELQGWAVVGPVSWWQIICILFCKLTLR